MPDRMYIMLDLWFGSASGNPTVARTPQGINNAYKVDYVRAWQFVDSDGCELIIFHSNRILPLYKIQFQ